MMRGAGSAQNGEHPSQSRMAGALRHLLAPHMPPDQQALYHASSGSAGHGVLRRLQMPVMGCGSFGGRRRGRGCFLGMICPLPDCLRNRKTGAAQGCLRLPVADRIAEVSLRADLVEQPTDLTGAIEGGGGLGHSHRVPSPGGRSKGTCRHLFMALRCNEKRNKMMHRLDKMRVPQPVGQTMRGAG